MRKEIYFNQIYHPTLHESAPRNSVNYIECRFCGQPMLRDSSNNEICARPMCRSVRMRMQTHPDFRPGRGRTKPPSRIEKLKAAAAQALDPVSALVQ